MQGAPPPEKQIIFSGVTAPKLARRAVEGAEDTKDEPWAWDAREFLRKKLIGEEVSFKFEKPPNATREYGVVYLVKDGVPENITESLVKEGLVTVRRTPDNAGLAELEDAAKAAGKGKWGPNPSEHVRDIKWSIENMRAFVDKAGGKPIKAIVEHVRDGSTIRAFLLPEFNHITLMISGIRCPAFKIDDKGRPDASVEVPFSKEARFYVETRLLQRDIEVILESVNNNNFVGTILHPKGNIAEALLSEGLGRCVDWSIAFMKSGADKLRAAEKKAKDAKKRMWKDWQSNAPIIPNKDKEFSGTVVEVVNGDALMVKMQSGLVKKIFLSSIRPPKEAGRAEGEDGKPVPRPKGFRPLYDIPWMFEAREFLRKKLIDKKVHVSVDYIQEARESFPEKTCATVTIGGVNVAEALVSKGLATVIRYRQDDDQRSAHYNDLLQAETKAAKSLKGVHAKKDIPSHRVHEIDSAKSKQYFSSFQRADRVNAIVEFVASGSRLRLYIPKEHCLATFLLGGINCPRGARPAMGNQPPTAAEPFGEEALVFTKERCLQKEVTIAVESTDKAGNFIGWLWIDNVNLSVALIEHGYAAMHPNADRSKYYRELKNAEDSAKAAKLRRWKNYVEEHEEEQKVEEDRANPERASNYEEVVITEVTREGTIYAQLVSKGPKAEAMSVKLRQEFQANPPLPGAYTPKRGDICAAKYSVDDEWYRAKVEKVTGGEANVLFIDYGNAETLSTSRLASLPAGYTSDKALATEYSLACVTLPKDPEYLEMCLKYLREDTSNRVLLLNVEYRAPGTPPAVTLLSENREDDIVKNLITDGLLLVEKRRERRLAKLLTEYRAAQDVAKKNHSNIWEYGDITEDDANEFGR